MRLVALAEGLANYALIEFTSAGGARDQLLEAIGALHVREQAGRG